MTVAELKEVLKFGESLAGKDYLDRMKEMRLLGDSSFVAELDGGVYLISYYHWDENRKKPATDLKSIPTLKTYMEKIEPLFAGSVSRLNGFLCKFTPFWRAFDKTFQDSS